LTIVPVPQFGALDLDHNAVRSGVFPGIVLPVENAPLGCCALFLMRRRKRAKLRTSIEELLPDTTARSMLFDLFGDFELEGERPGIVQLSCIVELGALLGLSSVAVRAAARLPR
jgi:hypothetical protein